MKSYKGLKTLLGLMVVLMLVVPGLSHGLGATETVNSTVIDSARATYGASAAAITPAATPTDVVVLYGASGYRVKVKKVVVSGVAASAGSMDVTIYKRTTAPTGGTSTAPSKGKMESTQAASEASLSQYSANPTVGTGIAVMTKTLNLGVAGAAGTVTFDFADDNLRPLTLLSATEGMAINLNGQAVPTTGKISYGVVWEETK